MSQCRSQYNITPITRYAVSTLIISNVISWYFSNIYVTYTEVVPITDLFFFFFMELFLDICYSEIFHSDLHNDNLPVAQSFRRYLMQESKEVVSTGPGSTQGQYAWHFSGTNWHEVRTFSISSVFFCSYHFRNASQSFVYNWRYTNLKLLSSLSKRLKNVAVTKKITRYQFRSHSCRMNTYDLNFR
jgi:hypothetical protein